MGYQIELRHFFYFKTLAEELHFRKAAERLFISQPGLSRQIKQMEEILNTRLLDRNKKEVHLTKAGQYLKSELDILFDHVDQIQNKLQKMEEGKIASLKLGFIGSAVQTILPKLLKKIKELQPLIEINLNELSNENQIELLLKNELDFGFMRLQENPVGLSSKPIVTEKFMLVLPKKHPCNRGTETDLLDFREESFILFAKEYSNSYYDLIMSIFHSHGFRPKVSLRTVNALTIFRLVEEGQGIAIVPTSLNKGYVTNLDFIVLDNIPQQTTLFMVWNERSKNIAKALVLNTFDQIAH